MRMDMHRARVSGPALAAAVMALGLVAGAAPLGRIARAAYPQRRGFVIVPQRPVNVDSSPAIAGLNKALRALAATDRSYDGHREKAVAHVGAAIRHLELPNAKG